MFLKVIDVEHYTDTLYEPDFIEKISEDDEEYQTTEYKSVLKNTDLLESVLEKYENSHDTGFLFKETVYNEF